MPQNVSMVPGIVYDLRTGQPMVPTYQVGGQAYYFPGVQPSAAASAPSASAQTRTVLSGGSASLPTTVGGAVNEYIQSLRTASERQRQREEQAYRALAGSLPIITSQARARVEGGKQYVRNAAADTVRAAQADTEEARRMARELGPRMQQRADEALARIAQRRQEAFESVERQRDATLGAYRNMTAADVQVRRSAIADPELVRREEEEIISQYAQQGFGRDSPQVQQALQVARADRARRIGNLAAEASVAYNEKVANLNLAYDNALQTMRSLHDQLESQSSLEYARMVGGAEEAAIERMQASDSLVNAIRSTALSQAAEMEYRSQSLGLAIDQLEAANQNILAETLRNMNEYVLPIATLAPLLADIAMSSSGTSVRGGGSGGSSYAPIISLRYPNSSGAGGTAVRQSYASATPAAARTYSTVPAAASGLPHYGEYDWEFQNWLENAPREQVENLIGSEDYNALMNRQYLDEGYLADVLRRARERAWGW